MRHDLLRKCHKPSTSAHASHFQNKADRCSYVHYNQHKIKLVMQTAFKMRSCKNLSIVSSCNIKNSYIIGKYSVLLDRHIRWNWANELQQEECWRGYLDIAEGRGDNQVTRRHCINPEKPCGYPGLNIHKLYILPTQCIYAFCMDLRTNSDYFPIQR
jgi:hypothetical protein